MSGPDQRKPSEPQSSEAPLSRREFFPSVVGGAAIIAAALTLGRSQMAEAQPKTSKKVAKYRDHPKNGQHCSVCQFFRPPHSCQLVSGSISPNGWCSYFAKKTG